MLLGALLITSTIRKVRAAVSGTRLMYRSAAMASGVTPVPSTSWLMQPATDRLITAAAHTLKPFMEYRPRCCTLLNGAADRWACHHYRRRYRNRSARETP